MVRLTKVYPPLGPHVLAGGVRPTINFSDPAAVRALNTALAVADYGLSAAFSDVLPPDALVPPIPGRADYVHYLADALRDSAGGGPTAQIPSGPDVRGFDIGTGAVCIYALLGAAAYGWSVVGSDVRPEHVRSSARIAAASGLAGRIDVRRQLDRDRVFGGVWERDEAFDFVMCNPPFYPSAEAFAAESRRKVRNLARGGKRRAGGRPGRDDSTAGGSGAGRKGSDNFGGSGSELWCKGGEVAFVSRMVEESARYADRCLWFTSLVSRQDNVDKIEKRFKVKKTELVVGSGETIKIWKKVRCGAGAKGSTILMWSYFPPEKHPEWARGRGWGPAEK